MNHAYSLRPRRRLITACAMVALAGAVTPWHVGRIATPVSDEAAAGGLEVIVVSARRRTETVQGRARQCDAVSGEEIRKQGPEQPGKAAAVTGFYRGRPSNGSALIDSAGIGSPRPRSALNSRWRRHRRRVLRQGASSKRILRSEGARSPEGPQALSSARTRPPA